MIKIIVSDERELADVLTRHDFASLFGCPYQILVQGPTGRPRVIGGGGITNVIHHNGPASLPGPLGGGAGGTGTVTVKRRTRK